MDIYKFYSITVSSMLSYEDLWIISKETFISKVYALD